MATKNVAGPAAKSASSSSMGAIAHQIVGEHVDGVARVRESKPQAALGSDLVGSPVGVEMVAASWNHRNELLWRFQGDIRAAVEIEAERTRTARRGGIIEINRNVRLRLPAPIEPAIQKAFFELSVPYERSAGRLHQTACRRQRWLHAKSAWRRPRGFRESAHRRREMCSAAAPFRAGPRLDSKSPGALPLMRSAEKGERLQIGIDRRGEDFLQNRMPIVGGSSGARQNQRKQFWILLCGQPKLRIGVREVSSAQKEIPVFEGDLGRARINGARPVRRRVPLPKDRRISPGRRQRPPNSGG